MDASRKPHPAAGGELNVDEPLREGLEERASNVSTPCPCTSLIPNSPAGHLAASVKPTNALEDGAMATAAPNAGNVRVRPRKYIHVVVRSSMGSEYSMRMRESDTVERIKLRISARSDIPCSKQQLIFKGVELQDQMVTARELGIQDGSVLTIIPKLQAGPLKMHEEGVQGNEDMLIDTVTSQLSDSYMSELFMSGQPVSLIAKVSGRFVVVRLRPRALAPASRSNPTVPSDSEVAPTNTMAEKQQRLTENERMKNRMEEVRAKMSERRQRSGGVSTTAAHKTCSTVDAAAGNFGSGRHRRGMSVSFLKNMAANECFSCGGRLCAHCYPCRCGHRFCPKHEPRRSHSCPYGSEE